MIILRINNMYGYRTKSLYMCISNTMEEKFHVSIIFSICDCDNEMI